MANFLLAYTGGGMGSPEEQQAVMAAWGAWFGALGNKVVDGGNPTGSGVTLRPDGSRTDGGAGNLTGYSVISADSLSAAADLAKGCPVLTSGGSVEVYEIIPVM
jgi:hypothetical protein